MDPLALRRDLLEGMGFVALEHDADHLVCARLRWNWDLFLRGSAIVRVRRLRAVELEPLRTEHRAFMNRSGAYDWSKVPRGFLMFRLIVDVMLVEPGAGDPEPLKRWARGQVSKGYGMSGHPVVVEADGTATFARPIWGAAFWEKNKALIEAVATGSPREEKAGAMGLLFGWLLFMPSVLILVLSCCGLPLLAVPLVRALETTPEAVPRPPGG